MARKTNTKTVSLQAFDKQLKLALKHYYDLEWLTANSPLAAPYFLGEFESTAPTQTARGVLLQAAIQQASYTLWGPSPPRSRADIENAMVDILQNPGSHRYSYLVLELRYFRQFFKPRKLSEIWEDFLGESRAEFYRDVDMAVQHLAHALLTLLQPTFRLETPIPTAVIFGRESLLSQITEKLRAGQTVALSGPGGVGKTTLGAAVAGPWPTPVFWFTVRPSLNDHLPSLLFALGYFLHRHGGSSLWRKLAANHGKIEDFNLALGLVRDDLAAVRPQRPLLCFDEMDRLRPADFGQITEAHRQLIEFIDSLRGLAPLLLIGQRIGVDTDHHVALPGLTEFQLADWLTHAAVPFSHTALSDLYAYTQGNARLCQLCITLRAEGESLADVLAQLPDTPALQPILDRLWLRTTAAEQQVLQLLSIFRNAVPLDALTQDHDSAVANLQERGLVLTDQQGGATLWPALRDLIYRELTAEQREQLHQIGASARMLRGEYTAAAYHYYKAGLYKESVHIWYPHRKEEINRGQGSAALELFQNISRHRLGKPEQRALVHLRAELYELAGENRRGLNEIESIKWPANSEHTAAISRLKGFFLNALGYPDQALTTYQDGMTVIARLLNQLAGFRHGRSRVHIQQRQMQEAWKEARLAQYETGSLLAVIQTEQGHFDKAYATYTAALELAQDLNFTAGIAKIHRDLVSLLRAQLQLDEARHHADEALKLYTQLGDRFNVALTKIALAGIHFQQGDYAEAVAVAQETLTFLERIQHPYLASIAAVTMAEAYYEMGQLNEAENFAHYSLQQEEIQNYPYSLFVLGGVWLARGELDAAAKMYADSVTVAAQNEDSYIAAYAHRALGEIYLAQQKHTAAQAALEMALRLFNEMGVAGELPKTEALLAEAQAQGMRG